MEATPIITLIYSIGLLAAYMFTANMDMTTARKIYSTFLWPVAGIVYLSKKIREWRSR